MSTDRFERQADLVPQSALREIKISVLGVGAIGRQVALQLAAIGACRLQLMDFDRVDETNVVTQGYWQQDVGQLKIEATAKAAKLINPDLHVEQINDRYRAQYPVGDAVFACVDSISVRGAIWRNAHDACRFFCDGRMLSETIRVLAITDAASRDYYPTTLFAAGEAVPGRCTAKSTIYTASIAAGLMVHQFTRWLREIPCDPDCMLDLLSGDLIQQGPAASNRLEKPVPV